MICVYMYLWQISTIKSKKEDKAQDESGEEDDRKLAKKGATKMQLGMKAMQVSRSNNGNMVPCTEKHWYFPT